MNSQEYQHLKKIKDIVDYFLIASIISLNQCVIISFLYRLNDHAKKFANWLLLHKALCDSFIAFHLVSLSVVETNGKCVFVEDFTCVLSGYVTVGALFLCIMERYCGSDDWPYYRKRITLCTLTFTIISVWVVSILFATIHGIICNDAVRCFLSSIPFPIAICAFVLGLVVKRRSKKIYGQQMLNAGAELSGEQSTRSMTEVENTRHVNVLMIMIVIYIVTTLLFTLLPLVIIQLLISNYKRSLVYDAWFSYVWFPYLQLCFSSANIATSTMGPFLTLFVLWSAVNDAKRSTVTMDMIKPPKELVVSENVPTGGRYARFENTM